ncbi:Endoplasmic reticulum metallopeptidase 1 [Blattella germanica]|nr:Endoplasmic reticulum metallopeptidase 1 [Blattella germanica]
MYRRMDEEGVRLRMTSGNEGNKKAQKQMERRGSKFSSNITFPSYTGVLILTIGFLFFGLAYFLHIRLPPILSTKDLNNYPDQFIGERALNHLKQLSNLGSKPVGSYENEVLAVEYLTREIKYIMQQKNEAQRISFDLQKCSGCYILGFKPHGFTNCYSQVQNIIVKLDSNSSSSLLINCHFDSVPTSPGASDDGLNCAAMLEVLKVLSQSSRTLKHNVVFLFNGAEESMLQASHCFITQHKWAHEVKAFINLEACGAGGREVLFQAGPNHPWLVQSGLVPSDTDFRIFRDFGNIPGLDFAHAINGYVYHTSYDSLHAIPAGTFQHTGDNLLALTKEIASSEILSNTGDYARLVHMKLWKILVAGLVVPLTGWLLAFIFMLITAFTLDLFGSSMSWFSRQWLIFCLYYCPTLVSCMLCPVLFVRFYNKQFLLTLILFVGTFCGFRSTYIIMLAVLFPTLSSFVVSLPRWRKHTHMWLAVYVISTFPFSLLMMYQAIMAFGLFVPISGRIGPGKNPDFIIGTLATLLCILASSYVTQFIILLKHRMRTLIALTSIYLLAVILVIATPLGFPFSANSSAPTPQRIHVYHADRTFHDISGHVRFQDSGYWLLNMDRHSPSSVRSLIPDVAKAQSVKSMCETELACGLPLWTARILQISEMTEWIPAPPPPTMHILTNLELISDGIDQIV